jgi:pilus assembly protein CpaB
MNRYRMLIGLAIALVVAFFASTYVYRQMQRRPVLTKQVQATQVVIAAENLPLGTRLDAQQLRLVPWPGDNPMPGMFMRVEDCVGRALIQSVVTNEPILEANLAPKEAGAGLSATIPEGMRALSIAVNDVIGVAGFVLPGTTVDVLATASVTGSENITRTILENIRVLAAGQKITQDKEGKPQTVSVVTLLVTPEDADKLTMASTQGRIQLALRNTIDTKKVNPAPVFLNSLLLGGIAAPSTGKRHAGPRKPEPEPYVVEVISGSKRETKSFKNP